MAWIRRHRAAGILSGGPPRTYRILVDLPPHPLHCAEVYQAPPSRAWLLAARGSALSADVLLLAGAKRKFHLQVFILGAGLALNKLNFQNR